MNRTHEREKQTISKMIGIYCRGKRHSPAGMCGECTGLLQYAYRQIDRCPFRDSIKPVCGLCRDNCFSPEMHRAFGQVMCYAGPRMMIRHPALTMAHFYDAVRYKMKAR